MNRAECQRTLTAVLPAWSDLVLGALALAVTVHARAPTVHFLWWLLWLELTRLICEIVVAACASVVDVAPA